MTGGRERGAADKLAVTIEHQDLQSDLWIGEDFGRRLPGKRRYPVSQCQPVVLSHLEGLHHSVGGRNAPHQMAVGAGLLLSLIHI